MTDGIPTRENGENREVGLKGKVPVHPAGWTQYRLQARHTTAQVPDTRQAPTPTCSPQPPCVTVQSVQDPVWVCKVCVCTG